MGKFTTNRVIWHSLDQQCQVTCTARIGDDDAPIETVDGRVIYDWSISQLRSDRPDKVYRLLAYNENVKEAVCSGVGNTPNALEGLKALASFIEAWVEALRYGGQSENRDLFPMSVEQILDEYHDELYMDTHQTDYMDYVLDDVLHSVKLAATEDAYNEVRDYVTNHYGEK